MLFLKKINNEGLLYHRKYSSLWQAKNPIANN